MFVTVISSTRISILGIDLADSIFVFIIRTLYFLENLSFSIYNGNIFITSELESEYLSNISKTEISHSIDGISKRDRPHLCHSTKSKRDRPHLSHSTKSKRNRPHLSHSTKSKRDRPHLSHSTKSKRGIPHVGHSGTPRYCDMKSNKKTNDTFENYHHETLPSLPDTDHHSRVNCGNCDIALCFHSSIHVCLATNETIKEFFNDGNKNDESNEMERDLQQCTDHDYNGMTWQLLSKELTKCRSTLSKSPSRKLANEMEILQRGQSNQGSWGSLVNSRFDLNCTCKNFPSAIVELVLYLSHILSPFNKVSFLRLKCEFTAFLADINNPVKGNFHQRDQLETTLSGCSLKGTNIPNVTQYSKRSMASRKENSESASVSTEGRRQRNVATSRIILHCHHTDGMIFCLKDCHVTSGTVLRLTDVHVNLGTFFSLVDFNAFGKKSLSQGDFHHEECKTKHLQFMGYSCMEVTIVSSIEIQTRKIESAVLVEAAKKRRKSVASKHLGNNDHTVRVRNKNMAVTDAGVFKSIISLTRPRRPIISLKRCNLFDDGSNCCEITCPQYSVDGKRLSPSRYGNSTFTGVDDINVTAIDELGVCPLWYNHYSCSTSEVTSYSVWPENCNRNENSTCDVRDDDLEGNHRDDSKFIYAHHPGTESKHASDDNDYIHNTQFARADYSGDRNVNSVLNACSGVDAEHFTSCFDAELISDNMFAANDVSYSNIIPQNVSDSNIIPNNENKDIVVSKNQNVSDSNIIPNNENKDIVVSKNQSEDVVHEETGNGDVNATHTAQHTSDSIDNTVQHTSDNTDNTDQHTSDDFNNTAQHTNDNIDITNQHTSDNIDNTCQHTSHNTDITYQHTSDNIDETNHTNVDTIVSEYSSNDDNDNDEHLNKKNNGEKNIKLPGKISSSEISPSLKRKFIMIDTECAENLRKTFPANPVLYDLQRNMANSVSQITSSNIKQMISLQTEKKLKDQKMQDPGTNLPSEMSTPYYSMYSFTPCSRDVLLTVNMLKAPQAQSPMMKTDVVHAGLESELRRLATFYSFQPPQGVFVIRLANNGFFYPAGDKSDVVECAFCLVTVPASKFSGRLVSEVHKEISPNCSFLLGTDTRNVSIATLSQNSGNQFVHQYGSNLYQGASSLLPVDSGPGNSQHHNGSSSVHSFQRAAVDLATDGEPLTLPTTVKGFDEPSFQAEVLHADLSAAGSGSAERTVPDSRPSLQQPLTDLNSRPNTTHRPAPTVSAYQTASYRPEATPYTMTPNNTESQEHTNTNNNTTGKVDGDGRRVVTYEQLGIYAQRPKRQDMAVTAVRINTFSTGWPHSEIQPPAKMATAGFFYTGRSDLVRCFHCKGGLKTWDASDDPWVEHGRWFPTCPFVRLNKGEKFVEAIKSLVTPDNQKITLAAVEQKVNEMEDAEKRQRAMVTFPSVLEGNQQGSATTGDQLNGLDFASLKNGTFLDDEDTLREISQRLEEENQEMKSYTLCKICQTEKVNVLLLPCGHLIACAQCAPALRNCAICRQPVKGTVRVQLDEEKT